MKTVNQLIEELKEFPGDSGICYIAQVNGLFTMFPVSMASIPDPERFKTIQCTEEDLKNPPPRLVLIS